MPGVVGNFLPLELTFGFPDERGWAGVLLFKFLFVYYFSSKVELAVAGVGKCPGKEFLKLHGTTDHCCIVSYTELPFALFNLLPFHCNGSSKADTGEQTNQCEA